MLTINRWRKYPKRKPKKVAEYYLCSVKNLETMGESRIMVLFYTWDHKFIDRSRTSVFDGYKVYKSGRAAIEENRVFGDSLCVRDDEVIAWKKLPKAYDWRKVKKIKEDYHE